MSQGRQSASRRPSVSTTGLSSAQIAAVTLHLQRAGVAYAADIHPRCAALIVSDPFKAPSKKVRAARLHNIPCVDMKWVLEGNCSVDRLANYDIIFAVRGCNICTTGLSAEDRYRVNEICGGSLETALTQQCKLLVAKELPRAESGGRTGGARTPKLRFAERRRIPCMTLSDFLLCFGSHCLPQMGWDPHSDLSCSVASATSLLNARVSFVGGRTSSQWTQNRISAGTAGRHDALGEARSSGRGTLDSISAVEDVGSGMEPMSDVCVFCLPSFSQLSVNEVIELVNAAGAHLTTVADDPRITHILVPGQAQAGGEDNAWERTISMEEVRGLARPGRAFVRSRWLEDCVSKKQRISCLPYLLAQPPAPAAPSPPPIVLAFSAFSRDEQRELCENVRLAGLPAVIQDVVFRKRNNRGGVMLESTTHVVISKERVGRSYTVRQLITEFGGGGEPPLLLVDVNWVTRSTAERRWLDCSPFVIPWSAYATAETASIPSNTAGALSDGPVPSNVMPAVHRDVCEAGTGSATRGTGAEVASSGTSLSSSVRRYRADTGPPTVPPECGGAAVVSINAPIPTSVGLLPNDGLSSGGALCVSPATHFAPDLTEAAAPSSDDARRRCGTVERTSTPQQGCGEGETGQGDEVEAEAEAEAEAGEETHSQTEGHPSKQGAALSPPSPPPPPVDEPPAGADGAAQADAPPLSLSEGRGTQGSLQLSAGSYADAETMPLSQHQRWDDLEATVLRAIAAPTNTTAAPHPPLATEEDAAGGHGDDAGQRGATPSPPPPPSLLARGSGGLPLLLGVDDGANRIAAATISVPAGVSTRLVGGTLGAIGAWASGGTSAPADSQLVYYDHNPAALVSRDDGGELAASAEDQGVAPPLNRGVAGGQERTPLPVFLFAEGRDLSDRGTILQPHWRVAASVDDCTHFVTNNLMPTVRLLSCIAQGKWVLRPSFIDAAAPGQATPLDERAHEWTRQVAEHRRLTRLAITLATGCELRRKAARTVHGELCGGGPGGVGRPRPFSQWRVTLTCSENRLLSFRRILECGGCTHVVASTAEELLHRTAMGPADEGGQGDESMWDVVLSDEKDWDLQQLEIFTTATLTWTPPPVLVIDYIMYYLCTESPMPERYDLLSRKRATRSVS